ncbi:hypothetical protein N9N67_09285 [Bacteriovoracaceae bacterium]|nr:hypothetical protein [Bacteriovoracaceae bacterium]
MKRLTRLIIYLKFKNNNHVFKNLDGEKVKNTKKNTLKRDGYNTSYYGDPYTYDWYNSEL